MLDQWFVMGNDVAGSTLSYAYDYRLVALSYLVACFASYAAVQLFAHVRTSGVGFQRLYWLLTSAVTMGGGVWSMHFIAMLAVKMEGETRYDQTITLISIVVAIMASAAAFSIVSSRALTSIRLALASLILGAGIGGMHYLGMAAMRMHAKILYDPAIFALSVIVAVALSFVSLKLLTRHQAREGKWLSGRSYLCASAMGLSVTAMHYTGMAATKFIPVDHAPTDGIALNAVFVSTVIGVLIFLIISLALAASVIAKKFKMDASRLRKSESILKATIKNTMNGIITIDETGLIRTFNPAAESMFGYSFAEMAGTDVSLLMPIQDREEHKEYVNDSNLHEPRIIDRRRDLTGRRKDGTTFSLELTVSPMIVDDERLYLGVCNDITERKQGQEELIRHRDHLEDLVADRTNEVRNQAEQLRKALDRERELNELQREFVSMVMHEYRTPLAIIDGVAQRINRRAGKLSVDDLVTRTGKIRTAVCRMTALIDSTMSLTRLESGNLTIKQKQCDIGTLVRITAAKQKDLVGAIHEIVIDTDALPRMILADQNLLEQAFTSLFDNALKYAPDNPRIEVSGYTDGAFAAVSIRDFGQGIQEQDQPRIFERFFRGKSTTTVPGTGVGLYLVKSIVEMHGGAVDVESTEGEGATFTVRLPIN